MSLRRRAAVIAALSGLVASPAARAAAPASAAPAACPNADQTTADATVAELASGVRCLLNQQRAGHGAPDVSANARLATAAGRHAADMVTRHYFAHTSLGGSTFVDRIRRARYVPSKGPWAAGEILLDPAFSEVGVGVTFGAPRAGQSPAITVDADFGHIG
jgi:uncharacterized protein YkwD